MCGLAGDAGPAFVTSLPQRGWPENLSEPPSRASGWRLRVGATRRQGVAPRGLGPWATVSRPASLAPRRLERGSAAAPAPSPARVAAPGAEMRPSLGRKASDSAGKRRSVTGRFAGPAVQGVSAGVIIVLHELYDTIGPAIRPCFLLCAWPAGNDEGAISCPQPTHLPSQTIHMLLLAGSASRSASGAGVGPSTAKGGPPLAVEEAG
jgi:hypothetical protein